MLDRFLYFKEEINIVLNKASLLSTTKQKDLAIESYNLKLEN